MGWLGRLITAAAQRGPIAVFSLFCGALISTPAILEAFGVGSVSANGHADLHIICGSVVVIVVYVMHCVCETTQAYIRTCVRVDPPPVPEGGTAPEPVEATHR